MLMVELEVVIIVILPVLDLMEIDKTLTHQTTKGPAVEIESLQTCFSKVKNEVQTYHE